MNIQTIPMKAVVYLSAIMFLVSCGGSSDDRQDGYSKTAKNPADSLFEVVMDEHDEAMAKMGRIANYRKQVDRKLDSLNNLKTSGKAATEKKFKDLGSELKQAEDRMNAWMHEFSIDSAQDDNDLRVKYLESEKTKVSKVKEEILAVVAKADSVLKN